MNHFFGQNLKAIRLEKKLSQEELGRQLNKGQKTIGNWETGYSQPCLEDLISISRFFEIDIDKLLKQEIKTDRLKSKVIRVTDRKENSGTGNFSFAIDDTKQPAKEQAKEDIPAEHSEIIWRDKYIAVLENQLFEAADPAISQPTVQDLMNQMIAIQKTLAEMNV